MLQSALRGCPPDVQSQIEYILSQLSSEDEGEGSDSGDEGGSEEEEDEEVGVVRGRVPNISLIINTMCVTIVMLINGTPRLVDTPHN